jgi:ABC-type Fe3+-hydroxamate transport system substrate-binding protein
MLRVLVGLCLSFLAFSCQKKEIVQSDCKAALGLDLNKPVTKVISLSPALSEWIAYFELDTFLIARTAYCNYPERLLSKKVVSAYPISTEELMALQPDVVLVQEGLNDADQVNALRKAGMNVLTVALNGPKDVMKLDSLLRFCLDWNTGNHAALWLKQFEEDKVQYDTLLPTMVLIEPTQLYVFGKGSFLSIDRETFVSAAPAVILHSQKAWTEATFLQRYPEWKILFANGTRLHYIPADWLMRPSPRMLTLLTELKRARLE